jgi:large subunit ribosomal protein L21
MGAAGRQQSANAGPARLKDREGTDMEAYAVVQTGGKQYLVQAKDTLKVEKLAAAPGDKVELANVLALSDGKTLTVGQPELSGAKVTATVVEQTLGDKLINFKRKRRKGYHRKIGHRQDLTVLKVETIG